MSNDGSIRKIQSELQDRITELEPKERSGKSFGHTFKLLKNSIIKWANYAYWGVKTSKEDRALHKIHTLLAQIDEHLNTSDKNSKLKSENLKELSHQLQQILNVFNTIKEKKSEKIVSGKIKHLEFMETRVSEMKTKIDNKQREAIHSELTKIFGQVNNLEDVVPGNNIGIWNKNKEEVISLIDKVQDPRYNYISLVKQAKDLIDGLYRNAKKNVPTDVYQEIDRLIGAEVFEGLPIFKKNE